MPPRTPKRDGLKKPSRSPALSVAAYERLAAALHAVATEVPARTSLRTATAFLTLAFTSAMGSSLTLTDLKDTMGEDVIGKTIDRTLNPLMEPTKKDPEALGWISQEMDEDDRRKKYLRLTPKGWAAAERIVAILEDIDHEASEEA